MKSFNACTLRHTSAPLPRTTGASAFTGDYRGERVVSVGVNLSPPDPDWNADRPDPAGSAAPYRVYNIGNNNPVPLLEFVDLLESRLGRKADRVYLPMQPGDVAITFADVADLARDTGYAPSTPVAEGIDRFVSWYQSYYGVPG